MMVFIVITTLFEHLDSNHLCDRSSFHTRLSHTHTLTPTRTLTLFVLSIVFPHTPLGLSTQCLHPAHPVPTIAARMMLTMFALVTLPAAVILSLPGLSVNIAA